LSEARETARQKALAGIRAAGEAGDWRALEAWRSFGAIDSAATRLISALLDDCTPRRSYVLKPPRTSGDSGGDQNAK